MKKAALHNLGCKVNAYETEVMEQKLAKSGYEIVDFSDKADVYIINTCTVTNMADRKSRQMLHRAKKNNPEAIVVAVGCYVQAAKEELLKDNSIDIIIGNNRKNDIIEILESYNKDDNTNIIDINKTNEYEEMELDTVTEHTRAYVKIQDGCNQFCSYCIIPYARGRVRSRKLENIIDEIKRVSKKGFKEIVLTGIHLSSYGIDFSKENITLLNVILEISKIDGVERIRLGSLEPRIVTEEFIKELSGIKEFCPHFHLSLQSGCNDTLQRMNRKYTTEEYYESCCTIRKYFKNAAITTDVIVGFPGETIEEFLKTKEFINKVKFYEMHIFKYSVRQGTKAATMENQISENIKNNRSEELLELNRKLSQKFREEFIGKEADVLFEEKILVNNKEYYVGYTKEYIKIAIESTINLSNTIKSVKIIDKLANEIMLAIF